MRKKFENYALSFFLVFAVVLLLPGSGLAKGLKKISIKPAKSKVNAGKKVNFTAVVKAKGKVNKGALWYVNDLLGGNSSVGTIVSKKGGKKAVYKSPSTAPNPSTVLIKAVSNENSAKSATAKVVIKDKKLKKSSLRVKGVAATGLPITGADVEVTNSKGKVVGNDTTDDVDGSYLVKIKKKKYDPPFLVKVTPSQGATPIYSLTSGTSKVANVTPLSDKAVESFIVKNGGSVADDDYSDDIKKIKETSADFDGEFEKAKDALKKAIGLDTIDIDFIKSKLDTEDPENEYEKILEAIKDSLENDNDPETEDIDDLIEVDDDFVNVNNNILLLYKNKGILNEDKSPEDFSEDDLPEIEGVITNPLTVTDTTTITGTVIVTNTITVNNVDLVISDTTQISIKDLNGNKISGTFADLTAGKFVEVKYFIQNDLFVATKVKVKSEKNDEGEDDYDGIISQKNDIAKSIVVDGKAIFVKNTTKIEVNEAVATFADLIVGQKVEVDTILTDGKLVATKIKVENQDSEDENDTEKVKGTISTINSSDNTIIVDGLVIAVTDNTKIELNDVLVSFSDLAVGQNVELKTVFANGSLEAVKIEVKIEDSDEGDNSDD